MKNERATWIVIVIAVLLCFQPSKGLAYAVPYVFVLLVLFLNETLTMIRRLVLWIAAWCVLGFVHAMVQRNFEMQAFLLSFFTYSSFVVLLIPGNVFSPALFDRVQKFLLAFVTFEALWGLVQAFYGYRAHDTFDKGNGDIVSGTIGFSVSDSASASNIMYAAAMVFIVLVLYPYVSARGKGYGKLWLAIAVVLLATVIHVLLFSMLAILCTFLLCAKVRQLKTISGPLFAVTVLVGFMLFLTPGSTRNVRYFGGQFLEGSTPKAKLFRESLFVLPSEVPQIAVVGVGPGQFSSRAAIISSGAYLSSRVKGTKSVVYSLLDAKTPELTNRYELPLYREIERVAYWGSTQTPFSSWVSVATEFGFLFMLCLVIGLVILVLRLAGMARLAPEQPRREIFALIASIIFLFLLGFQENYWEMPQAIFVGLLSMRFLYESAMCRLQLETAAQSDLGTAIPTHGEPLVAM